MMLHQWVPLDLGNRECQRSQRVLSGQQQLMVLLLDQWDRPDPLDRLGLQQLSQDLLDREGREAPYQQQLAT